MNTITIMTILTFVTTIAAYISLCRMLEFDFTNKKWLKVLMSTHNNTSQSSVAITISSSTVTDNTSDGAVAKENPPKVETKNEYAMDVSGIDGSYYVKLFSYLCESRWYKVWLE